MIAPIILFSRITLSLIPNKKIISAKQIHYLLQTVRSSTDAAMYL